MSQSLTMHRIVSLPQGTLIALSLVCSVPLVWLTARALRSTSNEPAYSEVAPEPVTGLEPLVTLTSTQIASVSIQTAPVQRVAIQPSTVVPGRLEYNEERHVAVKAPTDGVVVELKRIPGETVAKAMS